MWSTHVRADSALSKVLDQLTFADVLFEKKVPNHINGRVIENSAKTLKIERKKLSPMPAENINPTSSNTVFINTSLCSLPFIMLFYVISEILAFPDVLLILYRKWQSKAISGRDGLSRVIWNWSLTMRFYSKAWDAHRAIVIEDCLLTCHGYKYYPQDYKNVNSRCAARYCTAFSDQLLYLWHLFVSSWIMLNNLSPTVLMKFIISPMKLRAFFK